MAVGDVLDDPLQADHRAGLVPPRRRLDPDLTDRPIGTGELVLDLEGRPARDRAIDPAGEGGGLGLAQPAHKRRKRPRRILRREAIDAASLVRPGDLVGRPVPRPHAEPGQLFGRSQQAAGTGFPRLMRDRRQ